MCTVGDIYSDRWAPIVAPQTWPMPPTSVQPTIVIGVPREEFDALKREVEAMKVVLLAAKEYDAKHGQPDCEMADKVAILRAVAEAVGVDLDDVFGAKAT